MGGNDKMKKRLMCLFIILCMLVAIVPMTAFAALPEDPDAVTEGLPDGDLFEPDETESDPEVCAAEKSGESEILPMDASPYTYKVISEDEKTIRLTGFAAGTLSGDVVIPETIDGYTVVSLGNAAFGYNNSNIVSVTLPDTVKRIEDVNCFYQCRNLVAIYLPEEMEYIGVGAFSGCSALQSIVIPKGVKKLEKMFRGCTSLKEITIPASVTQIDAYSLSSTIGGTDIMSGITIKCAIGSWADQFAKSKGINVKYSDQPLFSYSDNLDGTITIDSMADDIEIIGTLEIPESYDGKTVTGIGDYAFCGRDDITAISLPATVRSIGFEAFADCKNISIFEVPDGVSELIQTFIGCTALRTVTIPESVTSITEETFFTTLKDDGGRPIPRLVIYCAEKSAAYNYAIENSIVYEAEAVIPEAWDGTVDTAWYDPDEIEYSISTAAELAGLRKLVNEGTELFYSKKVTLLDNINMEGTVWKVGIGYNTGNSEGEERCFNGVFDGNYHRIYNFTYDSNASADTVSDTWIPEISSHTKHGLFGELGRYGEVRNLGLENAHITAGSQQNKVTIYAGALAGRNSGTIRHSYVNGVVLSGGFYGSWCDHMYGGVAGSNLGTLQDIFVKDVDFTGIQAQLNSTRKGGLTSGNSGTVKDCYVYHPVYDSGEGYYQWNDAGEGTGKCPVMFYYDPITSTNSGTVENVFSSDTFTRNGWTVGVHAYDSFGEMTDKMVLGMTKLTFRSIAPAEADLTVETADGELSGADPEVYLELTQAANGESLNDETVLLKKNGEALNSFYIADSDDEAYPGSCILKLRDVLDWNTEYEISLSGVKDYWNRSFAPVSAVFQTTNELVYEEFALYENYGMANERKLTSLSGVSGPVTAVLKGLQNNGDRSYSAAFSVSVTADGQIVSGVANKVSIRAHETKSGAITVGTVELSGANAKNTEVQAVLYRSFGNVVPLIRSVQVK